MFSRGQTCRGRSQSPVVRIAEEMETEPSKPIDKMADDRRGRVAEGWRRIQDESQGLLRVAIIDVEDAVAHLARAAEGDVESRRLIALMNGTLEMLDGDGLVCLLCGAVLASPPRRTRSWPSMRTATTLGRQQPRDSAELAFAATRAQRVWRQRCTSICGRT
jgi:hypothetical protein